MNERPDNSGPSENEARLERLNRRLDQEALESNDCETVVLCPGCLHPMNIDSKPSSSRLPCERCGDVIEIDGKIRIFELLGAGGFGAVYRGYEYSEKRDVAVKMPLRLLSDSEEKQFLKEAKIGASLDHPRVVKIFYIGRSEGVPYIVSELIDGDTLSVGPPPSGNQIDRTARLFEKIVAGLQHAHDKGIVHRDIKPGNILIDQHGEPHLTDFGMAKITPNATLTLMAEATRQNQVNGTLLYTSPEQARGDANEADTHSDVFSIGAVMYQQLTGRLPFGASTSEFYRNVQNVEPARPRSINRHIPIDLETICLKSLEKQPELRYQSATDLLEDLRRFNEGVPIVSRPIAPAARVWRWCRRRPAMAALSALSVIAALTSVVLWQRNQAAQDKISLQTASENQAKAELAKTTSALEEETKRVNAMTSTWFTSFGSAEGDDSGAISRIIQESSPDSPQEQEARKALFDGAMSLKKAGGLMETEPGTEVSRFTKLLAKSHALFADQKLSEAITKSENFGLAWLTRAQLRTEFLGYAKSAVLPEWERAVELLPNASIAYSGRGWCLYTLERLKEAEADFQTSLKLDPKNEYAHRGLADILLINQDYQTASTHYEIAMTQPPRYHTDPRWCRLMREDASRARWGLAVEDFDRGNLLQALDHLLISLEVATAEDRPKIWANLLKVAKRDDIRGKFSAKDVLRAPRLPDPNDDPRFRSALEVVALIAEVTSASRDEDRVNALLAAVLKGEFQDEFDLECLNQIFVWHDSIAEEEQQRLSDFFDLLDERRHRLVTEREINLS